MSWYQGPDNYPYGGFYILPGLNSVDEFMLSIADTIEYDPGPINGGVSPLGLGDRIEEFANTQNGLSFGVQDQASLFVCTYNTLKANIDSGWPLILALNKYALGTDDGPYSAIGKHMVAVKGYNTGYGYEEPICVHMNTGIYGDVWWDYADLRADIVSIWSYEIIPGGSPGSFLNPPVLEAPENGDISSNKQPIMEWSNVTGASKYRIQIASQPDFSTVVYDQETTSSAFNIPSPLVDGTYFWRVVPRNSVGNWCHFSGGYSFTINTSTITIITNTDSLSVPEGLTAQFQVRLSSQPPSTITVAVTRTSGDSDISISSGSTLNFTTSNWSTWKTVTLAAAEDADAANGQATIQVSASGIPAKNVTAIEEDNDAVNFNLHGWDTLTVSEGNTCSVMVSLTAQPASNVYATMTKLEGDPDLTTDVGRTLTFTPSNWNQNQYFYVYAAEDLDAYDGTATFRISASGVASKDVVATEVDNDTMQFEIEWGIILITVPEGGTNTFRVRLTAQPISDYVVTVFRRYDTDDSDIVVQSGYSMVFNSSNYLNYQTVTLAALEDVDCTNGQAEIRIKGVGINKIYMSVITTEQDNDVLEILTSIPSISVPEGSMSTFQVRLSHQPASDTTVSIARISGDSDITVQEGATLVFSTSNWSQFQTVTLAAAEDADQVNGTATIRISSGGFETLQHLNRLSGYGLGFQSFTEPYLDSCGTFKDAIIAILEAIARQERQPLTERVRAGLKRAQGQKTRRGRPGGRPRAAFDRGLVVALRQEGRSWREIATRMHLGAGTVRTAFAQHSGASQPCQNPVDEVV